MNAQDVLDADSTIRFDGRVAIVTGAGSGLGRDYAKALAARGAAVVVNDLGTDPRGNVLSDIGARSAALGVVEEIGTAGGKAIACHESCATRAGGTAIVDAALNAFGRVDVLIHNAGFLRNAPFEELTDEQIRSIMDVHLMAAFYVGQPAWRAMQAAKYGRIVLTSSASAMFGSVWQANYGAAKAGLVGLMNSIGAEGEKYGIQVNALLPCGASRLGQGSDEWPADFHDGMPEDFALVAPGIRNEFVVPMAIWLASERCKANRALYTATGGRFARVFVGEADGWLSQHGRPPTPEDIERHLAEIDDTTHFDQPQSVWGEFESIISGYRAEAKRRLEPTGL
ncbi:NAD(P)-dependent dehydrogenase (short-subunit alcohol dehydrogenase family) [Paraburkholderia youngii]|uniref:SDR family NAD(P)-dependent oxidoreductase n=1 Tax=Paraburkholderia youngii TaxID=2782701 RepID=A0A7Y6K5Q5_9BURK|nr:SDR family NAD(P)-dependent oxidoreductase [Paraburkholderia youngii]NUY04897.1 SDR family NAD(P)-dependent oxidoreductase [Paraburkholderia youngii]